MFVKGASCQKRQVAILSFMIENLTVKNILAELKAGLKDIYGQHFRGFYLFGSYARGDQDLESDVDVLIVLDSFENYCFEIARSGALAAEISLKSDVSISRIFMRESEWLEQETPFLLNVRDEAIPA